MDRRRTPRPQPAADELARDVSVELGQIAHRGKARMVKDLVVSAGKAYQDEAYAQALTLALQAKKHAPRAASVRELLGLTYYRLGRWREAARELAAYRRLSDRRDEDHVYADCERALGRPDKALEVLQGVDPREVGEEVWVEGLVVAAGALGDLGRHREAVDLLRSGPLQGEPVHPYHLRLWYVLADALEHADDRAAARGWWDLIYAEDPDFFDVGDRRLGIGRG